MPETPGNSPLMSTTRLFWPREPPTSSWASHPPRTSHPTDFCSPGCPDDTRSALLLDTLGLATLTFLGLRALVSTASCCFDRSLQLWLPDLLGLSCVLHLDAWRTDASLPFSQPQSCMTYLCSRVLPREPLTSAASAAARTTTGPRRLVSLAETTGYNRWVKTV
ncbi:hypothetical protein CEP52_017602 [Fusarium oligoseptatum]|uniref:Uncharacterized protein n=1 Tax=Fusarium oligoseptatum TaxID=2604345 RepID=A0A428RMQ7_9HYPO|nr:hypothetical protein CEP52_017602 [Fusarium oligoseptatum]